MTLSLAGRCRRSGAIGAIVCSSSIAVASRCLWGSVHGIALSQNVTDPTLGQQGLQWLEQGHDAPIVLERILGATAYGEWRQLAVLDSHGQSAWASGAQALGTAAGAQSDGCVAIGNLLATPNVPQAMVNAFTGSAQLPLAERLLRALEAGLSAGGEAGPVHAVGMCVYERESWPVVDLRVDWSTQPIEELRALWERYQPQMADYVMRAKDPTRAPAFGVPGDP
jgi:uncharacterized Ntn-hydrolase superfamily protein